MSVLAEACILSVHRSYNQKRYFDDGSIKLEKKVQVQVLCLGPGMSRKGRAASKVS
jgi:hypothetical protein